MALHLKQLNIFKDGSLMLSLDATVKKGEVLSVMGPSGSGKSTLLQAIAGHLAAPFSMTGKILIDNQSIDDKPAHLRGIGIMFQDALLFEHMTVEQNIIFAMPKTKRYSVSKKRESVSNMLEAVGLEGMQNRAVTTLSGGQQARISLLRSLAAEPRAVLLDEPFSKLDTALRDQIRTWTLDQLRSRGIPALLVTHDSDDAVAAGGQTFELLPC